MPVFMKLSQRISILWDNIHYILQTEIFTKITLGISITCTAFFLKKKSWEGNFFIKILAMRKYKDA